MADAQLVAVRVNRELVESVDSSKTLSAVVQKIANDRGIKTFNVLVNGNKATADQGGKTLIALSATTIEIVTKDARGAGRQASRPRPKRASSLRAKKTAAKTNKASSPFHKGQAVMLRDQGIIARITGIMGKGLYIVESGGDSLTVTQSNVRALTAAESGR